MAEYCPYGIKIQFVIQEQLYWKIGNFKGQTFAVHRFLLSFSPWFVHPVKWDKTMDNRTPDLIVFLPSPSVFGCKPRIPEGFRQILSFYSRISFSLFSILFISFNWTYCFRFGYIWYFIQPSGTLFSLSLSRIAPENYCRAIIRFLRIYSWNAKWWKNFITTFFSPENFLQNNIDSSFSIYLFKLNYLFLMKSFGESFNLNGHGAWCWNENWNNKIKILL